MPVSSAQEHRGQSATAAAGPRSRRKSRYDGGGRQWFRFANASRGLAALDEMDLDRRRLIDPQHAIVVEIALLDPAVFDRDFAVERGRDSEIRPPCTCAMTVSGLTTIPVRPPRRRVAHGLRRRCPLQPRRRSQQNFRTRSEPQFRGRPSSAARRPNPPCSRPDRSPRSGAGFCPSIFAAKRDWILSGPSSQVRP